MPCTHEVSVCIKTREIKITLKGKTQLPTKIKFYKVMAVPVLMYGRSDKRKIEVAEMRFLRSIAGYTLLDKKRSSDIRKLGSNGK